ncbi:MAG: hypothetical protein ACFFBP_04855 [Promethearchaeota archaeon]
MNDKKFMIFYIVGLSITTVLMILILLGVIALNSTFLVFFWALKFLSGFGLILSISSAFLFLLDKFANKIGKRGVQVIVIFQIIIPIILIIYGIYNAISSAISPGGSQEFLSWLIQTILFIYGIASLLLTLYLIPIIRDEFQEAVDRGRFKRFAGKAKEAGRGVKKRYFSFRKKYAKAQLQDQKSIKETMELYRRKLAVYFLIPIAIGSLIFTPISFICVLFLLGLVIDSFDEPRNYERIAIIISIIFIAIIAILYPFGKADFFTAITPLFWTIDIFYLIGIILASILFIYKIIKLKGITLDIVKEKVKKIKKENNNKSE